MERETRTKDKILALVSRPRTYTELKETLAISDPVIQKHLRDLREYGLIKKNEDGLYELTEKGQGALRTMQLGDVTESVGQFDQLISSLEKSKLDPNTRLLLFSYGFLLAVEKASAQATKGKLVEIHNEASARIQSLRKSLEKYAPEYTGPFEAMFGQDPKRPHGIESITLLLLLIEPFRKANDRNITDAYKLLRKLYAELWKGRLKGLVGL